MSILLLRRCQWILDDHHHGGKHNQGELLTPNRRWVCVSLGQGPQGLPYSYLVFGPLLPTEGVARRPGDNGWSWG